ncbi:MAG: Transcriptional regulator [Sphingomonas bacterium]|uniref:type IV toxin-antitoxin system AbiEi family antitoxin domain-containing protein n=1 Tax=Sphingomonas bacterium TaxID=1895847 RepID=UPI002626CC3C|nr:AbiEi antitoxin N-terminal domain-containing protein [Sphingomonas bacterium]MDB5709805.1 Transcriptional regulator [Sphingomonas bacterium]
MASVPATQRDHLRTLLAHSPVVRAQELRAAGIAGATIARALKEGDIDRVARGLYQRPGAPIDTAHALAETGKRIPKGVIAMLSALAFHGLTDQMPRKVWVAIGPGDWSPVPSYPPTRIVRFSEKYLRQGIEHHVISGISVPVYSIPKTLADLFRNSKLVDRSVAVEGLRAALDQRKTTPGAIAEAAEAGGAWRIMRPYLEALTFNG